MEMFASLGYSSFAPDMPGFGQWFGPSEDPLNIAWYADLYATTSGALPAFQKGCHLLGHHSSGVIGTRRAVSNPELVRSLTIVTPAFLTAEERNVMRQIYLAPFNKRVADGSHLLKKWEYVRAGDEKISRHDLQLLRRETLDHIKAWRGGTQIYRVWDYDGIADAKYRVLF